MTAGGRFSVRARAAAWVSLGLLCVAAWSVWFFRFPSGRTSFARVVTLGAVLGAGLCLYRAVTVVRSSRSGPPAGAPPAGDDTAVPR